METDTLGAFRYITGPLSPSAEQAIARAKELAQRVLPSEKALDRQRQGDHEPDKTGVTLEIDDTVKVVIARVVDSDTGELIRQFPSKAAVRFAAASREMMKHEDPAKTADLDIKTLSTTDVTV